MYKEVYFHLYCSNCKHSDKKEYEDPCNECLNSECREDSHKPLMYQEGGIYKSETIKSKKAKAKS